MSHSGKSTFIEIILLFYSYYFPQNPALISRRSVALATAWAVPKIRQDLHSGRSQQAEKDLRRIFSVKLGLYKPLLSWRADDNSKWLNNYETKV